MLLQPGFHLSAACAGWPQLDQWSSSRGLMTGQVPATSVRWHESGGCRVAMSVTSVNLSQRSQATAQAAAEDNCEPSHNVLAYSWNLKKSPRFNYKAIDKTRSQICTCHDSSAVVTWAKFWPDEIIIHLFIWEHYSFLQTLDYKPISHLRGAQGQWWFNHFITIRQSRLKQIG